MRTMAALVCAAVLVGCSDDPASGPSSPPAATTGGTATASATADDLAPRVEEAKQLVVRDHGVDAADLTLVLAETVDWPDSSYGCPLTDETYETGSFPGHRIVLALGHREFTFTGAVDTELKECLYLE